MSLSLTNESKFIGSEGDTDWWSWIAYVEGDDDELDDIESVEYRLPPGFPSPVKRIRNRDSQFAFQAQGWGVFELKAKVIFKSGKRPKVLRHYLEFEDAE